MKLGRLVSLCAVEVVAKVKLGRFIFSMLWLMSATGAADAGGAADAADATDAADAPCSG